jgi:hypothetical protein
MKHLWSTLESRKNGPGGIYNSPMFLSNISVTVLMDRQLPGVICMHHNPTKGIILKISSFPCVSEPWRSTGKRS